MNRFVFFVRNNILAFLIFIVLVASVFFAWYFIHPSSPFQKKQSFVIFFNKIGFLQKGNLVRVNGSQKGEIRKIELLEEGVLVTARIFADYEIPVNSEFRLINAGLVGKQELSILVGDALETLKSGDTVQGNVDQDFSDIGRNIRRCGHIKKCSWCFYGFLKRSIFEAFIKIDSKQMDLLIKRF